MSGREDEVFGESGLETAVSLLISIRLNQLTGRDSSTLLYGFS